MKFDDVISRADDETIQILLGVDEIRLLKSLDPKLVSPIFLKRLIIETFSYEGILLNKEKRNLLFSLLRENELIHLGETLGISKPVKKYDTLSKVRFSKYSNNEYILFRYFDLLAPAKHEMEDVENICLPKYSLFTHQRTAVVKSIQMLSKEPKRLLLHMPTGSGKTRTAMHIIANHFHRNEPTVVIWLAYSEELCVQATEEFQKAWMYLGNRDLSIGRFWGSHDIIIGSLSDGIVIAGLDKTYNLGKKSIKEISRFAENCSLVIIDEAHQSVAETYQIVLNTLLGTGCPTQLLGLSATPGRSWDDIDSDKQLSRYFFEKKVSLEIQGYENPIDYLIKEGYLAETVFKSLFSSGGLGLRNRDLERLRNEIDIPMDILNKLGESEKRNLAIIAEAQRLMARHKRILIFAASVRHAKLLSVVFRARGIQSEYIISGTDPLRRSKIISEFKSDSDVNMVLCNFGVLTTGFDAPKTSAAIIARPTKSLVLYSQMVGRVTRGPKAGGNKTAEVSTVVDIEIPGFRNLVEAHQNWEDVWR